MLNCLRKIAEKIAANQLTYWIQKSNLLNKNQINDRKNWSVVDRNYKFNLWYSTCISKKSCFNYYLVKCEESVWSCFKNSVIKCNKITQIIILIDLTNQIIHEKSKNWFDI